ncbi:MAG: hypothetical protein AB7N54_05945 [Alphaproteobacteria bacterium]
MDINAIRSVSTLAPASQSVISDKAPPQSFKRQEIGGVKDLTPDAAPPANGARGKVVDIAA